MCERPPTLRRNPIPIFNLDVDKARLARTLSPGTICSLVEPHDDVPRTRRPNTNRFTSASSAGPVSARPEDHADTETLLAASWSASGGLGIDEVDEDVELGLIGEAGGGGGLDGDVLRLGPWVNQVCASSVYRLAWIICNNMPTDAHNSQPANASRDSHAAIQAHGVRPLRSCSTVCSTVTN